MKYKMSKTRETLMLAALFLSNSIVMVDCILTPIINDIYAMFGSDVGTANYAITGCYFIVVILSLFMGKLCNRYDKKKLLVIGGLFGVAGGIGMLFIDPMIMCVARSLMMIAYSITSPVAMAMITDLYTNDPLKLDRVFGFYNASMSGIGILFSLLAGILATYSIFAAYCLHAVIILYLVMLIVFVPSMKEPVTKISKAFPDGSDVSDVTVHEKLGRKYWGILITYLFSLYAYDAIIYYVSVYVAENGLGTEAISGVLAMMISAIGFVVPLGYGHFASRFGWKCSPVGYAICLVGFLLLMFSPTIAMAFLGIGLIGGGGALTRTDLMSDIAMVSPASRVNDGLSFYVCGATLSVCLTTYLTTWGMDLLGMSTFTAFLIVPVIITALAAVASLFVYRGTHKEAKPQFN